MAQENLCTFVLDYRGGTYISQVEARGPAEALEAWLDTIDLDEITGLTNRSRARFRESILSHHNDIVPVNEVQNVWCASGVVRGALALVHIIHTHGERPRRRRSAKR